MKCKASLCHTIEDKEINVRGHWTPFAKLQFRQRQAGPRLMSVPQKPRWSTAKAAVPLLWWLWALSGHSMLPAGHQHQHLSAALHRAMPQTSVARLADLSQVIYWNLSLPIPLQCPPTKSFGVAEWNPPLHPLPKQSILICSKRCPTAGPEFFLTSHLFPPTRGHQHCILWHNFTTKRVPQKETGGGRNKRDSSSRFQICSNPLFLGAPIFIFFSQGFDSETTLVTASWSH